MNILKTTKILLGLVAVLVFTACEKQPEASFTVPGTTVNILEEIVFTNTSKNSTTYQWDFGDGNTATVASPTHTYTEGGTYNVTLTASGNEGSDTFSKTIEVLSADIGIYVYMYNPNDENDTNTAVDNCEVEIFETEQDWLDYTNGLGYATTDANGEVLFTEVAPIVYYIDAYKEINASSAYTNWDLGNMTPTAITAGEENWYSVGVQQTAVTAKKEKKKYRVVKVEKMVR